MGDPTAIAEMIAEAEKRREERLRVAAHMVAAILANPSMIGMDAVKRGLEAADRLLAEIGAPEEKTNA